MSTWEARLATISLKANKYAGIFVGFLLLSGSLRKVRFIFVC
jgi:hypothetical protein